MWQLKISEENRFGGKILHFLDMIVISDIIQAESIKKRASKEDKFWILFGSQSNLLPRTSNASHSTSYMVYHDQGEDEYVLKVTILHIIANLLLYKSNETGVDDFIIDVIEQNLFDEYPWGKIYFDMTFASF